MILMAMGWVISKGVFRSWTIRKAWGLAGFG